MTSQTRGALRSARTAPDVLDNGRQSSRLRAGGKPGVSTTVGCEGLRVASGENILVADDPETLSDFVLQSFANEEQCLRLGENARELVERVYDWGVIGGQLIDAYMCALGTRSCTGEAAVQPLAGDASRAGVK